MRRFFGFLLIALLLVAGIGLGLVWWIVHRALPQLDGAAALPELRQEVTVDRDAWGVPHIRAASVEDMLTAQGYVMAQDRLWQMDVLRRLAAGELSEIFGARAVGFDRQYRTLGLRGVAEREAAQMYPRTRALLEAYVLGVNRYIAERGNRLPWEFVAMRYKPRPWTAADSLLIAGYMYQTLTNTWPAELKRARVTDLAGPDLAKDLFVADSPHDRYVVDSAPAVPDKRGVKPQPPPVPRPGPPQGSGFSGGVARLAPLAPAAGWPLAQEVLERFAEDVRAAIGSNNWVVDGSHTASGKPLLANDTHLTLSVPCIWYMIHLTAPGWNVKGFTLPGAPGVIIGHNDRIAWGFTNNGADVEDLYIETFNPQNPREYLVNGNWISAEVRTERIHVRGDDDVVFDVFVTRHGPVVSRDGVTRRYALRWTALEPGGLGPGYTWLGTAGNWEEFREALRRVPGPAQNAVYADVDGNIGFIVTGRVPLRKNGDGSVPVSGDTDDYEWTGYIPFDEMPQVLNPPGGIIATANARVVGPGYPHYLTDRWASPYRTERIYRLLEEKKNLRPADFLAIQNDIFSPPHKFLAEQLVAAARVAPPKDARARDLIARLAGWDGRALAGSAETSFLDFTRKLFLARLLEPLLGQETSLYDWRDAVFVEKILRERPARWLPREYPSYDELLVACANQAVERLAEQMPADSPAWHWGRLNALRMDHPLGRSGISHKLLSVGPTEQDGTVYSIKAMQPSHGPAMRFVADLSDLDNSLMNLTLGQSGQYGSPNYRDQFAAWFGGRGIPAPFSDSVEGKARAHGLRLVPAGAPPSH